MILGNDGSIERLQGQQPKFCDESVKIVMKRSGEYTISTDHVIPVRSNSHFGNRKDLSNERVRMISAGDFLGLWNSHSKQKSFSLACVPSYHSSGELPEIDGYILGVILGDGTVTGGGVEFASAFGEVNSMITERLPENLKISQYSDLKYAITMVSRQGKQSKSGETIHPLKRELERIGVYGLHSPEKFIPEEIFHSDISYRYDLLRGLMDTDGSAEKNGGICFSSISERLIIDVRRLVASLGGLSSVPYPGKKKGYRDCFKINLTMPEPEMSFSLERKRKRTRKIKRKTHRVYDKIKTVELLYGELEMVVTESAVSYTSILLA